MAFSIRDTALGDLAEIYRISCDEAVRPHQYKLRANDSIDVWADLLSGRTRIGKATFHCSTILCDQQIIGYVMQHHFNSDGVRLVQCGWDLDPQYWGRGIMASALAVLFDRFFVENGIHHVFADCFRDNSRCKRVMKKLGFVANGILLHHRILIAWKMRCFRWIERYRLDSNSWKCCHVERTPDGQLIDPSKNCDRPLR